MRAIIGVAALICGIGIYNAGTDQNNFSLTTVGTSRQARTQAIELLAKHKLRAGHDTLKAGWSQLGWLVDGIATGADGKTHNVSVGFYVDRQRNDPMWAAGRVSVDGKPIQDGEK